MSTASGSSAGAPAPVVTAYRLYLASVVLGVIGLVISLILLPTTIDAAVRSAQQQVQGRDTGGVDVVGLGTGIAIGASVFGVVVAVAFAVLTVVFARKMLRGRNWARIVLTVFAGLHLLGLLGLVGPGASPLLGVVSLLEIVAGAAAAVLTFLPASAPWFRRSTMPWVAP